MPDFLMFGNQRTEAHPGPRYPAFLQGSLNLLPKRLLIRIISILLLQVPFTKQLTEELLGQTSRQDFRALQLHILLSVEKIRTGFGFRFQDIPMETKFLNRSMAA